MVSGSHVVAGGFWCREKWLLSIGAEVKMVSCDFTCHPMVYGLLFDWSLYPSCIEQDHIRFLDVKVVGFFEMQHWLHPSVTFLRSYWLIVLVYSSSKEG